MSCRPPLRMSGRAKWEGRPDAEELLNNLSKQFENAGGTTELRASGARVESDYACSPSRIMS